MVPFAIEGFTAVIAIDCSVAAVTARAITLDVTPLWVAVMLLEPIPTPVASPLALIEATEVVEEFHVAELVRFCVVPSLNVPVAVKSSIVPFAIDVVVAVMLIDCRAAAVILSAIVFELTPLCVAVMLLDPTARPVASPLALIVAAAVFDELHAAELVKFCVLPSLNVPVAVN